MNPSLEKVFLCLCISLATIKSVYSINCYQCSGTDSNNPFQCNEFLENDVDLVPTDCATIFDAQYCIKHVGRFEGGIGTKRYCSSRDLGNYCNYVQQPGDKLEYRTCIYTCDTDGCNSATSLKIPAVFTLLVIAVKYFVL
ncbi:glycosylphosphatidylinositol anchored membrane protein boudin isoform X1 [Anticarsia gemmatalis]|uniref:glycosylphosphatidylinositol anchored membrane protein boudin isoform X1 n=1 Tax=Anticarsia gemmatalis TaxID=129554 RepID=UPI003F75D8AD